MENTSYNIDAIKNRILLLTEKIHSIQELGLFGCGQFESAECSERLCEYECEVSDLTALLEQLAAR